MHFELWLICLIVSICCPVVAVAVTAMINGKRVAKKRKLSVFYMLLAGVAAASFVMFLAVHGAAAELNLWGIGRAILLSVFNAIQLFALGCEFSVVKETVELCPQWLQVGFQAWAALLYVAAPVFTFGAVLSLFKNLFAWVKWRWGAYFKEAFVFSQLNERSLALANDIHKGHPKAAIVFTEVSEEDASAVKWLEEAKQIGAICFPEDILSIKFGKHGANQTISFFAIGIDESENLNYALKLIESYKDRENTNLYVFSTKISSELALTTVDKGQIKVRRINDVRSLVNRLLYTDGQVLFSSARPNPEGDKSISAVVIGMGRYGTEMVKALSWYCQMDGYRLKINAFDQDPLAEDKFMALAPELMDPAYNGVIVEGEAQYEITVHSGQDVQTATFAKTIASITDATYVLVALGNDEVNLETAVRLRMYFERIHIHPVIHTIVYSTGQKKALTDLHNYKKQAYDITLIGDLESFYTENTILNSALEKEALAHHLKWGEEDVFWTYEYNYRSSIATAIHHHARQVCNIPGASKAEDELTPEERDVIERLEHRRWNAYMRSEGYVYSGSDEEASRNDLGKMHNDLVNFSVLSEEERRKDSRVGTV